MEYRVYWKNAERGYLTQTNKEDFLEEVISCQIFKIEIAVKQGKKRRKGVLEDGMANINLVCYDFHSESGIG